MVRRELLSTLRGWRAFFLLLLFSAITGAYVALCDARFGLDDFDFRDHAHLELSLCLTEQR